MSNLIEFYDLDPTLRKKITKGKIKEPKKYITARFLKITTYPKSKNPLPTHIKITPQHIICASLSLGYLTPNKALPNFYSWAIPSQKRIRYFLCLSAIRIISLMNFKNNTASMASFYSDLDSTDQASISYFLGSIITYLTARIWIKSSHDRLYLFAHERLFTNAMNLNKEGKHPDFVAITEKNEIHIFESKGGQSPWEQVIAGLAQLDEMKQKVSGGISIISTAHPVFPKSYVCVQSVITENKAIQVRAFDPPGEKESQSLDSPTTLDLDYIKMVKILEAVDTIASFDNGDLDINDENVAWLKITSFKNFLLEKSTIAIPKIYIQKSLIIRSFLMLHNYSESIPDDQRENSNTTPTLVKIFRKETTDLIEQTILEKWLAMPDGKACTLAEMIEIARNETISDLRTIENDLYNHINPFQKPGDWDFILDMRGMILANEDHRQLSLENGI